MYFFIGGAVGIFNGIIFALLHFSLSKKWQVFNTTAGPAVTFFAVYEILSNMTTVIPLNVLQYLCSYFVTLVVTIILSFLVLQKYLKANDIPINLIDFLFAHKELKNTYMNLTKKKSEGKYLTESLSNKEIELEEAENDIKLREAVCKQKENAINAMLDSGGIYLYLPNKNKIPLDSNFLEEIPIMVSNLVRFSKDMESTTKKCIEKYKISDNQTFDKKLEIFKNFTEELCLCICDHFFTPSEVRVHFRYLNNDYYEKFVVVSEGRKDNSELKKINIKKGMIYCAGKNKRSLIKSLNYKHHIKGGNDTKWVEYITLVFDEFYQNEFPMFSMGIDVKNKHKYKNNLYFLNYCKIEDVIQSYILELNSEINLFDLINEITA